VPKDEYERLYPDAAPISSLLSLGLGDQDLQQWLRDETVRIAEYFYREYKAETLNLYPNNITAFNNTPDDKQLKMLYGKPLKTRISQREKVCWVKSNGYEVLEKRDWAGKYIPIVRVVGNEFEVNGQIYVSGLVRNAKDAQRMYNYWVSQEAEMLALAPKAPFIGYGGQFEGYETQWKTANTTNWPYLEVNPDVTDGAGATLPLPQRAQPPMASTGLLQAKSGASEDIKAATGQYNASLGMGGNERSGKAILARQREGDVGTYHYVDNLARAIRYVTRQLLDMIPKIYDTQRIARIIGEDGDTEMAKIDPSQEMPVKRIVNQEGIEIDKIYNPNVGKYDVVVTTGPSYSTRRQETREEMAQLLQGNPALMQIAGDLFVKAMDWPGADELAKRLAKTIDPKLLSDDEDPALQAANMQMQAMGQEMQQMQEMLQNVQESMEAQTLEIKRFDSEVKAYDVETKRMTAMAAAMTPDQIQEIVLGTVQGMITSGDLMSSMPQDQMMPPEMMPPPNQGM
jgi:hypothetical protein